MKSALNEEVPYRSPIDVMNPEPEKTFTQDEADNSTLLRVRTLLREAVTALDQFHAFDLTESELKLKQQIKAHQIAYDILSPLLETVEQAIRTNDTRYKQRNNQ